MKKSIIILGIIFHLQINAQLCFNPDVNYGHFRATSVTAGDFNGDGKKDLALGGNVNYLYVLLGNGTGSFGTVDSFLVNTNNSNEILTNDFNGDGKADLAVLNISGISVLLGTGSGSFLSETTFSVASSGVGGGSLISADFNSDGKADLATAVGGSIAILLGTGTGSFSAATSYTAISIGTPKFVSADFNNDGKLDLVATTDNPNGISVLLGNGSGSFASAVSYTASAGFWGITTSDFNGDGNKDIAVAGNGPISILLGNGTGSFSQYTSLNTLGTCCFDDDQSITTADFNGDGKADLATADQYNDEVSVFLGTGTGGFNTAVNFTVNGQDMSITTSDFNGDSKADLAAADIDVGVSILLNCTTMGIEQYANNKIEVNIYPNPNNGSFVIEPSSATKQSMQVYDVNGKLVLSQAIIGKTTIDAGSLNEGVYNISIISNEGVINKRLVIVR